jgi:L-fuconolactonase
MVIDHIAKPSIATGEFDDWARGMEAVCKAPMLYCKLSGMITEAAWNNWSAADLRPYVDFVLQGFGAERSMFGSDWPVCTQAMGPQPMETRERILGGTATEFYRL